MFPVICLLLLLPPQPPGADYDTLLFHNLIPPDQLTFLNQLAGASTNNVLKDKQFRKLMQAMVPDCMFHYGRDMPLSEALETVLRGSKEPLQIRDGGYVTISGHMGAYLSGRGFLWIDLRQGVGLGGFYFHPTNEEPTPTVAVFSRQVNDVSLSMSQLPPPFADDLILWGRAERVPSLTTRYFITGSKRRILLEHDEDYCA